MLLSHVQAQQKVLDDYVSAFCLVIPHLSQPTCGRQNTICQIVSKLVLEGRILAVLDLLLRYQHWIHSSSLGVMGYANNKQHCVWSFPLHLGIKKNLL